MPGLWPMQVDASGCKKPDMSSQTMPYNGVSGATSSKPLGVLEPAGRLSLSDGSPAKQDGVLGTQTEFDSSVNDISEPTVPKPVVSHILPNDVVDKISSQTSPETASVSSAKIAFKKRELDEETGIDPHPPAVSKPPECEPQGLASPPFANQEDFGIGGQADSTYEYLPKEFLLLGGLEDKYRTMYERFAESTTKNLLFRGMIPDDKRHILHAGRAKVTDKDKPFNLVPEGTHLTCFAGGMYALGARTFGRDADMDIAKKLTDGCVWAYESTTTGIMPENYLAIKCPDANDCPWNETLWHDALDPYAEMREKQRLQTQQMALERDKKLALQKAEEKTMAEKVTNADLPEGAIKSDRVEAPIEAEASAVDSPISQKKADEAVSKPIADKPLDPEQEKAERAVSKPSDGAAVEKMQPIESDPEASAEKSTSKPVEGALPPKSIAKRQLGDINETPLAASVPTHVEEPAAPLAPAPFKASDPDKATQEQSMSNNLRASDAQTIAEKPSADQQLDKTHVPANPQSSTATQSAIPANNTVKSIQTAQQPYHEIPLPTHEEFVAARIRDERIPKGMTKIDGKRYLLR